MSSFDSTPPPPTMVDCPKCGFYQPKDQYCAKCGVDMYKVPRNPAAAVFKLLKKPATLAAVGVFAVIITVTAVRTMRHKVPAFSEQDSRSRELRARVTLQSQNNFAAAETSVATSRENSNDLRESASSSPSDSSADLAPAAEAEAMPIGAATAGKGSSDFKTDVRALTDVKISADSKGAIDSAPVGLQVAFAWAEVTREWLQAMGAASPGPHRIGDLDSRLRESVGGYKILDVSRQKIADKQEPIVLNHGTNLSARFESTGAGESSLSGSIQPSLRGSDGAVRMAPPVQISMDKGQGIIVTLGAAPAAATTPGTTVTEIVLLILPRWGTNPKP